MDFTSTLYLGLLHRHETLRPWTQFTTGAPAALVQPPGYETVSRGISKLQGCEQGFVGPSTLHLFCDLFVLFPSRDFSIYIDVETYPIVKWCIERAIVRGVVVRNMNHFDVNALNSQMNATLKKGTMPLVVTDGYCRSCGRVAPIPEYLAILNDYGGYLIVDDTQALGILGHKPNTRNPYGNGGGGALRYCDAKSSRLIVISSLAKALGTPIAVLAGSANVIRKFKNISGTRVHCSPPSIPVLRAAENAIKFNQAFGDRIRMHLIRLVSYFKTRITQFGIPTIESLFPMQTLLLPEWTDVSALHFNLLRFGINTVLHRVHGMATPCISFIITARHRKEDIDRAVDSLQRSSPLLCKNRQMDFN